MYNSLRSRQKDGEMAQSSTSWRAGQSGNPAGRSRSEFALRDHARTFTQEALDTIANVMRDENAPPDARIRAAEALLNRGWGKPPAPMEVSGGVTVSIADAIRAATARREVEDGVSDTQQALALPSH
jgi:hypothetical protein